MPFVHRLVVPYYQVDQQGVVFNMWYLGWFDDAMTAYLASIGHPYDAMARDGLDVQLVHSEIDWSGGVRFGDDVAVEVTSDGVGTTSFTLGFRVLRGGQEAARGRTVYVVVALDGTGKRELPAAMRAALAA